MSYQYTEGYIYFIENKVDGKKYVGQSIHKDRPLDHLAGRKNGSTLVIRAMKKYGRENFKYEIIEVVNLTGLSTKGVRERMCVREQHWMDFHGCTAPSGYNICPAAGSTLGLERTDEWRANIAKTMIDREITWGDKISKAHIGVPLTAEHRAAVSRGNMGKIPTAEHRANISRSKMGIPCTVECRAAISKTLMGRTLSDEHRAAIMGNTNALGHKVSDECRAKLSKASMGNTNAKATAISVNVFDLTKNFLYNFPSMKSASKELGIKKSNAVCYNCRANKDGFVKPYGKYYFRYA